MKQRITVITIGVDDLEKSVRFIAMDWDYRPKEL